ncbi:hypothetical protein HPB48_012582 [Haemaphysalis longicornis]|uniref:Notch ligand N-terminal domain-containing protein n=1 Tax=Haemaphysalis longicornis TaxID=44386 RepID=A0A9J6GC08_HAELO|nr:hypothetical protein HPB48_012582 [Haemaphysalis longicornis]
MGPTTKKKGGGGDARVVTLLWWWLLALCCAPGGARASGFFELQVLGIENPGGLLLDGGCCGQRCPGRCNTYFRLCLKEYQSQVDLSGACTFGNLTSPLIGGSSFSLQTHPDRQLLLRLPFHFRWTVSAARKGRGERPPPARSSLAARTGRRKRVPAHGAIAPNPTSTFLAAREWPSGHLPPVVRRADGEGGVYESCGSPGSSSGSQA